MLHRLVPPDEFLIRNLNIFVFMVINRLPGNTIEFHSVGGADSNAFGEVHALDEWFILGRLLVESYSGEIRDELGLWLEG
jgi:hypothetical protein